MMRTGSLAILCAGILAGCSETYNVPPAAVTRGPHQGTAYRLPRDQGFVEIVNEPEVTDRNSKAPTAIVAYFLQPDGSSAMATAPTDVSIEIDRGDRQREKMALNAEPRSGDPAGSARFVSKPGPYALGGFRVGLSAKIGGEIVTESYDAGR